MRRVSRKLSTLVITLCFLLMALTPAYAIGSDYTGHWASATIQKWVSAGLLAGDANGLVRPDNPITRAEFYALINRVFNFTDKADKSFSDVKSTAWYVDDIAKATAAGLLKGYGNGLARPEGPISRQEAAVIITKAFNLKALKLDVVKKFTDADKFPSWSRDAIAAMAEKGYISGKPDKSFGYAANITRAESVTMINNAMGELKNKAGTYQGDVAGNLVVNTRDVVLKDMTINGSLYLTQGIGDGNITLDNVKVIGDTYVNGGGDHSIVIKNSSLSGTMIVLKKDGKVRIVAQGSSEIKNVQLDSGAILKEDGSTGVGFGSLHVVQKLEVGQEITLEGDFEEIEVKAAETSIKVLDGKVENLEVAKTAEGTVIDVAKEATVATLKVDASVSVSGQGAITNANINADNVVLEQKPENYTVAEGTTADIGGSEVTGTGTATPPPVVPGGGGIYIPPTTPTPPTTISGKVTTELAESATSANIQLKQGASNVGSAVSPGADGSYTIANVTAGTYSIEVSLGGYATGIIPSFTVNGSPITGKDILLKKPVQTVSGKMRAFFPYTAVPGSSQGLELSYEPGEEFKDGTVVFNIPSGFTVEGSDKVQIGTMSSYVNVSSCQQAEISNNGNTLTLRNLDLQPLGSTGIFDCILLDLNSRTVPVQGTYNFSVTADADGVKTAKLPSSGMGTEFRTFYAAPDPIFNISGKSGNGTATISFVKASGATSVILEQSTNEITYTTVSAVQLNADSDTATVTGLTNGTIYYFRLNVADGPRYGASTDVTILPTVVNTTNSSIAIDKPLAIGSTSIITVTLRDDSGSIINTKDGIIIKKGIATKEQEQITSVTPDSNGQITITVSVPNNITADYTVKIMDTNRNVIGTEFKYTYTP